MSPQEIVVNNNALFVNFSGKCFQSGCYISSSWETLSLESHNCPPSQPTENYITKKVCFFIHDGKYAGFLSDEDILAMHIQKTLQGKISLFKALYRTLS